MIEFYLDMLKANKISFPDKYIFFHINEKNRAAREMDHSKNSGTNSDQISRKIGRYRKLSIQQYDYFLKLSEAFSDLAVFIESNDISESVDKVLSLSQPYDYKDSDIFQFILGWRNDS
ncbi:hypothetical protein [Celerinatantimonas yamalensis]|uniref:Uncharacterized protein n=1 Tax=Celerinatantimonas yamalensis TaxID=559956 RepID=A0ABW9G4C4_9GAMM